MEQKELDRILKLHSEWLQGLSTGIQANLRYANLSSANLSSANLRSANLSSANLSYANLSSADLRYANLSSADLRYANLRYANGLEESIYSQFKIVPSEGTFVGYKKVRNDVILTLQIYQPAISYIAGRKCRAKTVKVLKAETKDGMLLTKEVGELQVFSSSYDSNFLYEVGKKVTEKNFDSNYTVECSTGIHFFLTKQEAIEF